MTTTTEKSKSASFQFCENAGRRGTNFLHPGLISEALRLNLPLVKIPAPRFTKEEVSAGFARGEQLIWFSSKDADDSPITMKRLYEKLENKAPLGGKLFHDIDWYKNEPFFSEETARAEQNGLGSWRFVGISAVPGTEGKNYLRQTIIAAQYVQETIYGGSPPEALLPILNEPAEREEELTALIGKDWKRGAQALAELPFNSEFRMTPLEASVSVITNQFVNKTRILVGKYAWTPSRSLVGHLVDFGDAGECGACLCDWYPRDADDYLGFFLSRSDTAKREP